MGFSGGTSGKEPAFQCGRYETLVQSLGQEDLEKGMVIHPSIFLPGKSHEQRSLAGYST